MIILTICQTLNTKLVNFVSEIKKTTSYDVVIVYKDSNKDSLLDTLTSFDCMVLQTNKELVQFGLNYIKNNYNSGKIVVVNDFNKNNLIGIEELTNKIEDQTISIINKQTHKNIFQLLRTKVISNINLNLHGFEYNALEWLLLTHGDNFDYEQNLLSQAANNDYELREINISYKMYLKSIAKANIAFFLFTFISLTSFLIDYIIAVQLINFLPLSLSNVTIASIAARAISSIYNFFMNKFFTFSSTVESKNNIFSEYLKYFILVLLIIGLSSFGTYILIDLFNLSTGISKIIIDAILFIISYFSQKYIIFSK